MTTINSLIDISFIQTNSAITNAIDMNSRSIYNIREIGVKDKSGSGDLSIIKYGNTNIIDDSNNDIIISNIYKFKSSLLDTSNINYDLLDCSGTFSCLSLDASNITTYIIDCSGVFKTEDLSLVNLNTVNLDCSNITSNEIYSNNITLNQVTDISNNIYIFNSHIILDASDNSTFEFIKTNSNKILSYTNNINNITFDSSYVAIYGVLRVALLQATTYEDTTWSYFGSTTIIRKVQFSSDDRIKHNELPLSNAILTINKLKPKIYIKTQTLYDADMSFNSNNIPSNSTQSSGYIAQDISNDIPELKHIVNTVNTVDDNILSVNYTGIQPYITKSIQELDSLLNVNDISLSDLENRIRTLESN